MNEFRTKIAENGRIIIPIACRRLLKLKPGQELIIHIEDDEMHLYSLNHSLKKAQALIRSYTNKKSLVQKLKKLRNEDKKHER